MRVSGTEPRWLHRWEAGVRTPSLQRRLVQECPVLQVEHNMVQDVEARCNNKVQSDIVNRRGEDTSQCSKVEVGTLEEVPSALHQVGLQKTAGHLRC